MIGLRDNLTLAVTKLRTRRVRLIVTLVVSGLLFTVLVAGSLVGRGILASLDSFTKEGFSQRFLVSVSDVGEHADTTFDPVLIKRAEAIQKDLIARKTAEAKRLGVPYDPATEPKLTFEGGPDGPKQIGLSSELPAAKQAILEQKQKATSLRSKLQNVAQGYGLKGVYSGYRLASSDIGSYEMATIVSGKETSSPHNNAGSQDALAAFATNTQLLDNALLEPFLLQNASLASKPGDPLPILAPVDAVEKLLGLTSLSTKASAPAKLARLKELRAKSSKLIVSVCYRNAEAVSLRDLAKKQADEAVSEKGKPDYVVPAVQYSIPTTPCALPTVVKDTRTAAEKSAAAKLETFERTFGAEAPQATVMQYRVVGILPQLNFGSSAFSLEDLLSSMITSNLGTGWFISREAALSDPILGKLAPTAEQDVSPFQQAYVELDTRENQKRFLDERSCRPPNDPAIAIGGPNMADPTVECRKHNQYFMMPYGNPLATLYDSQNGFDSFLRGLLLVLAGLSAIIMMGTVGKIIADGRKETSVFRAVGAKRHHIAQVYLLYAAILAALSFIVALGLGLLIALWVEVRVSPGVSVAAVLAFNSANADKAFHLIGLNVLDLLGIFGFALATGLLSAVLPLLSNLSRNPIKDMREE